MHCLTDFQLKIHLLFAFASYLVYLTFKAYYLAYYPFTFQSRLEWFLIFLQDPKHF